jgi:class 3 adenylate cyclase/tetratricopeptide (TPR) repeat protein
MAEARKTVTIVFSDVSGSTALGEQLDAEAMRRVMERYFEEMRAALERHGGTVEKFIGDAVMAVFGIPTVHEDDALRAVRAASEMRDRLTALNEEFERERGVTIAVRTGVNTGEVVAGNTAEGQAFATGDAVNVAARLEQAAEPGEILLGPLTYELVRDAVRAEPAGPLALKGKADPLEAWRLLEALPDAPAFVRRLDAPFVGREREQAALRESFRRVRESDSCELVTIVGPPGVGKSRLARELVQEVAAESRVVVGRCLPYGEGITYWPLVEIIRQAAGSDTQRGLAELMADAVGGALAADRIGVAVGSVDAQAHSEEIFWAVRMLFEQLARERPLVVVLDDLQWAEPTLLDLVEYLVGFVTAPVLIVGTARPDLFDVRPSWSLPSPRTATAVLEPLAADESAELVERLLAKTEVPEELRERILDTAEGNPLFVEQMLAHAREHGAGDLVVPPTILALLVARLDQLDPLERAVLERGAVEGRLFHRGAVSALLPEEDRDDVPALLLALARKEFLRPDRALFPQDDGYRFAHILVRDAAYEASPKELRAELHERFAAWLEGRADGRLAEVDELLGYHFEQSFRYLAELGTIDDRARALAARAAARLAAAGKRALDRGDLHATRNLLGRAFSLSVTGDADRHDILADLVDAQFGLGDYGGAEALLASVRGESDPQLGAYAGLCEAYLRIQTDPEGSSERALEAAGTAIQLFEETTDDRGLARAWMLIGFVHWQRGELSRTREVDERALAAAVRAGDRRREAEADKTIGATFYFGALPIPEVLADIEERRERFRARGDLLSEAEALCPLAVCHASEGRFDEAWSLAERGESLLEELGNPVHGASFNSRAQIAYLAGDLTAAEEHYRRGVETLSRFGDRGFLSTQAANLARVLCDQRRMKEAQTFVELSREAGASDDVSTQAGWRSVQARILAERGERAEAERLANEAITLIARTEYLDAQAETLLDAGEAFANVGNRTAAEGAIAEAARLFEAKGIVVRAERARARLAELQSVGSPSQ